MFSLNFTKPRLKNQVTEEFRFKKTCVTYMWRRIHRLFGIRQGGKIDFLFIKKLRYSKILINFLIDSTLGTPTRPQYFY